MELLDLYKKVNEHLQNANINQEDGLPNIPKEVIIFLGKLLLLKGVPFYYLVPHENYCLKQSSQEPLMEMKALLRVVASDYLG
jgi:hypothetical protein